MKKIGKLNINPERLMKNEELLALRGGYGWVTCRTSGGTICLSGKIGDCSMAREACDTWCLDGWETNVCTGD